ncbi:MAG: ArsA family ATPase, partial [Actinobacteria bacterium]|nr:ArsA family ATPase [Actinomycetota bacterium]
GIAALSDIADELWSEHDPMDRLVDRRPLRLRREHDGFELAVDLPFADRGDVDVGRSGNELVVTLGPHRRSLALPESLRRREVSGACVADGALRVRFRDPVAAG